MVHMLPELQLGGAVHAYILYDHYLIHWELDFQSECKGYVHRLSEVMELEVAAGLDRATSVDELHTPNC